MRSMRRQRQSGQEASDSRFQSGGGTVRSERDKIFKRLQGALLVWYRANHRTLPWRKSKSPYRIFLSEMMLQQTQVDRVIPKYRAFLAQFPTIRQLAAAPLAEVIRLWAGLGYNRRAVHLHRAAQAVVREHGGTFPMCLQELLRLPGVGAYTARALLSFANDAPVAVVDTNVRRVLGRVFRDELQAIFGLEGPTERQVQALADGLLPDGQSARWNQALMDLGSTVCTSRRPDCPGCPLSAWCQAWQGAEVTDLPSLRPKGQAKFSGSRRYYRGRIIAVLRDSPQEAALSFNDIASCVRDDTAAELTMAWLWELTKGLERDGLVVIAGDRDSWSKATVRLPS